MRRFLAILLFSLAVVPSTLAQSRSTVKPAPLVPSAAAQPRSTTKPEPPADPYRNYRYRLSLGGPYVAAFSGFEQINSSSPPAHPTSAAAANAVGNSLVASGGGSGESGTGAGLPVEVPGSLVGRPGMVTLICAPNNPVANMTAAQGTTGARPGTVTLVCSFPASNGHTGGGTAGNASGSGAGVPTKSRSESQFDAVTLQRGVTRDPGFESWASSARGNSPRDLLVDVFNEAGSRTTGYRLRRCTVVMFQGIPLLDDGAHALSIEVLQFHCEPAVVH